VNPDVRKVMFAGDWHGNLTWAVNCVGMAQMAKVDAIVQLGDFGIWPGPTGQRYLNMLEDALASVDLTCYFIDGNHEDFPQLHAYPLDDDGTRIVRPHIRHLPRGYRWEWAGLTFLALGGATSLDRPMRRPYKSWWPEEELTAADIKLAVAGGPVDVMLTHDAPSGVEIPGINAETDKMWPWQELARANENRARLGRVVDELTPHRLLHGHFHIAYDARRGITAVSGLGTDGAYDNVRTLNLRSDL
jgi:Icc-related predicted phosphoesterase